ncbi:MAG: site-specific integrase [Candidatus Aenigmarchaeota archaeon]|nr:site-specific integrase [Candidatus Aenigmarchaeota archaeon]
MYKELLINEPGALAPRGGFHHAHLSCNALIGYLQGSGFSPREAKSYLTLLQENDAAGSLEEPALLFIHKAVFSQLPREPCHLISREEVARLLSSSSLRGSLMLELLYLGLKPSEAASLEKDDVDLKKRILILKHREVTLPSRMLPRLEFYLRHALRDENPHLFQGPNGKGISVFEIESIVEHARKKSLLSKPLSPEALRRSRALHLLEDGKPPEEIQELLGILEKGGCDDVSNEYLECIENAQ